MDLFRRFFFEGEVPMVADRRSLKRKVLIDACRRNGMVTFFRDERIHGERHVKIQWEERGRT